MIKQKKSKISIPCHWNKEVLKKVFIQNQRAKSIEIAEVYGVIPRQIIGSGRSSSTIPNISKEKAIDFKNFIKKLDFNFVYLLNAPFDLSAKNIKATEEYLDWVINKFSPDALVVTSYSLMKFIRKKYDKKIKIYISTIAGILTPSDVEKYLEINPTRIILHHDANRNFKSLKEFGQLAKKNKIEVELMLTESCLKRCPRRAEHYNALLYPNADDRKFHFFCITKKLMFLNELLKANFIRPEDINLYEKMGFKNFKITGRSKPAKWLPEVTNAYLNRSYEGNLIRLLGVDSRLNAEDLIFINNKSLDNFLLFYPRDNNGEKENLYTNKWTVKLFKNKDLKIMEKNFFYQIEKNKVICKQMGQKLFEIYKKNDL